MILLREEFNLVAKLNNKNSVEFDIDTDQSGQFICGMQINCDDKTRNPFICYYFPLADLSTLFNEAKALFEQGVQRNQYIDQFSSIKPWLLITDEKSDSAKRFIDLHFDGTHGVNFIFGFEADEFLNLHSVLIPWLDGLMQSAKQPQAQTA